MPQQIFVALLPHLVPSNQEDHLAIVIDTLRFTTTACQALSVGASRLSVVNEVDDARRMVKDHHPTPLLCGERLCRPIAGFDLGNSPYDYTSERVAGRPLLFTTTNGTRAVNAAQTASRILLGSLVNRTSTARATRDSAALRIWIICSGTDGEVACEDVLAAGSIIAALQAIDSTSTIGNDAGLLAVRSWRVFSNLPSDRQGLEITDFFRQTSGGANLVDNGYETDLEFSARVDSLSVVPGSDGASKDTFVSL